MIVLLQRQLAPYRISVLNMLSEALGGELMVMHVRLDPTNDRQWAIAWDEVKFQTATLSGYRINVGSGTVELSYHVGSTLAEFRPQVVVLSGWDTHASWTALSWARRHGVPVIVWVASTQHAGKHRGWASDAARRYFLRRCAAAVVPGISAEAFVRKLAPSLPTYRVTNAIDEPDLRALGAPPRDGAALFMGALSRRKGVDLILEAAGDILTIFPRLIIAGNGPLRDEVVALAARLPGLEYAGFAEGRDKTRLFQQSSALLLPSRKDPWLLVASEALVARRPVVLGPGVGAIPDLQPIAGDAVVLMRAATPEELVNAARQVRDQVVPASLSEAFRPGEQAAAMAAAFRSTMSR
jgi:glycosyltransferase involved in cell wall biosynthesis